MSDRRRLNLSLSMKATHQREAWKILRGIPPGQRTDAVCQMVCRAQEQERLLDAVRIGNRNIRMTACRADSRRVPGIYPLAQQMQGHRPVHGACIHINISKPLCHSLRHSALAGSRRSVYRYLVTHPFNPLACLSIFSSTLSKSALFTL